MGECIAAFTEVALPAGDACVGYVNFSRVIGGAVITVRQRDWTQAQLFLSTKDWLALLRDLTGEEARYRRGATRLG